MAKPGILVTGGAGYIGSHVVRQLGEAGERVVVLDNLGKGFRQAVTAGELIVGEVGDQALVSRLMAEHQVDTVMHFAAHTIVPESVALPLKYYGNNTCSTRALLQACLDNGVRHFVFSSTAAVYGMPEEGYASEESPTRPINAYGTSKLMTRMDASGCGSGESAALRGVALFQRGGLGPLRPDRSGDARGDAPDQGGVRGHGGQAAACFHLRHAITPRRTAPACGTISTSRIWPRRICGPSIICGPAAARSP